MRFNKYLEESLATAGVEGFVGGAAMMVGSITAAKIYAKIQKGKAKRKAIEALEDQKRLLRKQMKDKDDASKASIRIRIENIDRKIENIKRGG